MAPSDRARLATILDGWGIAPRALLVDPDPAVRSYAAATATLDADPDALAEVRAALRDPDAVNRWFGDDPQRSGWFLSTLTKALLRRTTTFEDIEQEAMAALAPDATPGRTPS